MFLYRFALLGGTDETAEIHLKKGDSFARNFALDSAIYYYDLAESHYFSTRNMVKLEKVNFRIAMWYNQLKKREKALTYINKSIRYFSSGDSLALANYIFAKATKLGWMNRPDSMFKYLMIARDINKTYGDTLLNMLIDVAEYHYYTKKGDTSIAIRKLYSAYQFSSQTEKTQKHRSWITSTLGDYNRKKGRYRASLKFYAQSLKWIRPENYDMFALVHMHSAYCYQKLGVFDSAYFHQWKHSYFRRLDHERKQDELALKLEARFDNRKKENEILQLRLANLQNSKEKQQLIFFVVLSVLISSLLLWGVIGNRRKLKANKLLALQKDQIYQQRIVELKQQVELDALSSLLKGQEQERARIARELHDSIGGSLLMVKMSLEAAGEDNTPELTERLEKPRKLIDEGIQKVRDVSRNIVPRVLEKFGLPHAISDLTDRLKQVSRIRFHDSFIGLDNGMRFPEEIELNLYRCAEEALYNSIKHSQGTAVFITFQLNDENHLPLAHAENGKGFNQ